MKVTPDEEEVAVDAIPLATKPLSIVDYKIIKEGKISYFQIIRADGSSKRYSAFIQMLRNFDREDLEILWKLVKAKHMYTRLEDGYERGRIVGIKRLLDDLRVTAAKELALMCGRMFPEESDQVEKYVRGLPDMIQGSVMASKPKTMREAIKIANDLMDQNVRAYTERQAENKRKFDNNNEAQQQPPKKQSVATAYTAGSGERKEYVGTLPLCNKCKFYHNGPCTAKCTNCKKVDHLTRDCWNPTATSNQRTITGYECRNQGHYKSDCPELKNRNHGNQAEGTETRGMVYALGGGETIQDLDDMEDDINA
ncbi:reverse transcriptase domain-containing protein [Tanacetum coccineum]